MAGGNHVLRVVLLVSMVLLSGCATVGIESTVAADGTIGEYTMEIDTSRQVYGLLKKGAENNGYDSLEESFTSDVNDSAVGEISYDEEFDGDDVTMTITMRDVDPSALDNVSVSREDGRMVYVDETFYNESAAQANGSESELARTMTSGFAVDYTLTMPGEIVASNADEVDGNTAEWHTTGSGAFTDTRIYAESEVPTAAFGPGFGVVPALVGLLVAVALLATRRC